jgi:hypothetical protein
MIEAGAIVHRVPGGVPAHDNVTLPLNPATGINSKEYVAVSPADTVRLPGDPKTAKPEVAPGGTTVTVVEPQTTPAHALTVDVPALTPKTTPLFVESFIVPLLLPESFVTVATAGLEEFQITEASDWVLLSLNMPIAVIA